MIMLKNTLLMGLATVLLSRKVLVITEQRVPEYCWYENQQVDVHTVRRAGCHIRGKVITL